MAIPPLIVYSSCIVIVSRFCYIMSETTFALFGLCERRDVQKLKQAMESTYKAATAISPQ